MSRSRKKTPINKDNGRSKKIGKKFANKKVRSYNNELANGKAYKKLYESWDIADYVTRETYLEAIQYYETHKDDKWFDFSSLEEYLQFWKKIYVYK